MGFVKTAAEVSEIEQLFNKGQFTTESVTIEFETTAEFLREVLPPCFDMPDTPLCYANVSHWQSALCGEFDCGIIYLSCKHKGEAGTTMLTLFVSGDMPVTIGREMWGEGKKTGIARFYRDGDEVYGYCERNGVRLIEIDAILGPDKGPYKGVVKDWELKAQPHTTGLGFQNKVVLSCLDTAEDYRVTREGTGSLKLAGTDMDPLHTIPVVKVGGVSYAEGASCWTIPSWEVLDDGIDYRPWIYGQKYDDFRYFHRPKRFAK